MVRVSPPVLVEIAGILSIAGCYIAAAISLGADQALLSMAVGAIVFIVTRRRYKR